jgi:hypothetical protein
MSSWIMSCLEREKLGQSIVASWSVRIERLDNAWEMFLADSYCNLAIDLKMKQDRTFWRGLLQDLRAGCRTETRHRRVVRSEQV